MALNARILHRIKQMIADAHSAFVVNYISPNAVPPDVLKRLQALGMVRPQVKSLEQAYLLGRTIQAAQAQKVEPAKRTPRKAPVGPVGPIRPISIQGVLGTQTTPIAPSQTPASAAPLAGITVGGKPGVGIPILKQTNGKALDLAGLQQVLQRNPIPLTPTETAALDVDATRMAEYIVGLGNRVSQTTGNILIEADRKLDRNYRRTVRDAVQGNIVRRESVQRLRSDLGFATGDWGRDLDRIAVTEKHNALQQGYANALESQDGDDSRVVILVGPTACMTCRRLYLEPDGRPRIFKLSTLRANGTNFGVKAKDAKEVIPPNHPNCLCSMTGLSPGASVDAQGKVVYQRVNQKSHPPRMTLKKGHHALLAR